MNPNAKVIMDLKYFVNDASKGGKCFLVMTMLCSDQHSVFPNMPHSSAQLYINSPLHQLCNNPIQPKSLANKGTR